MLEDKRECGTDQNFEEPGAGQDENGKLVHYVFLECIKHAPTGARYRVTYQGEVLIASTRDPEHDAARKLLRRGITGMLETWRHGVPYAAMRLDIEDAAKWTITEGPCTPLHRVRWRSYPKSRSK